MSFTPATRPGASNHLIAALSPKERAALRASYEEVELKFGELLVEPGQRIRHVYFPLEGSYVSLLTPVVEAAGLEVGLVGFEGMFGVSLILGVEESPLRALVQGGRAALRMSAPAFRRALRNSPALRQRLDRYLYVLLAQITQSAACTRFHVIEARLARWLLMTADRACSNRFHVTHEFLAWMLGVRRAGVTKAANGLQAQGLVTYKRGDITVLNRPALEAAACPCYRVGQEVYSKILR